MNNLSLDMEVVVSPNLTLGVNTGTIMHTIDHRQMTYRDAAEQHPISAITDLTEELDSKQDNLISGQNIKTINGNNILGAGNLDTPDTQYTEGTAIDISAEHVISVDATEINYNDLYNKPVIPVVPTKVSAFENDVGYLTQHQDISGKVDRIELKPVAFSGAYNDLTGKPYIPTKVSDLSNDTGFITNAALTPYRTSANQDVIDAGKQATLVSGTNIKTINNVSLLGPGNINVNMPSEYLERASVSDDTLYLKPHNQGTIIFQGGKINDVRVNGTTVVANKIANIDITGKEDITNKTTVLNDQSTDTQYPSARVTYDKIEEVREIAEGKTATYVLDASLEANAAFRTDNASITITDFTDLNGIVRTSDDLKVGDNIYVTQLEYFDRWVSAIDTVNHTATCHKLETVKVPVTDVEVDGTSVVDNTVAKIQLQSRFDEKVDKLAIPITAGTHTKITYNSDGLVTAGANLAAADIPTLTLDKIGDVTATYSEVNKLHNLSTTSEELEYVHNVTGAIQDQLDSKVFKNENITPGIHTKITYDAKGLVTSGEDLTANDIPALSITKITDITAEASNINKLTGLTTTATELGYVHNVTSSIQDQLDTKSTVSVSSTGTATDKVQYITINGVEKKMGSDDPTEYTTKLEEDLYTYVNIGKITGASQTNPVKVADAGDPLKDVFNAILGTEVDVNPTINQGGTTFTKSAQTGTTSVSGAEIGESIAAQTGTVTFTVTNTSTCSYGLKAGTYDTYSKTTATTFNYPIKTRTISTYSYQVRIKYPTLNGCTLSVTAGTLVWNDTTNSYLYCNVDANNKVTVSIAIPANTSTASAITRFNQLEADVDFSPATYQGVAVDNFWTYLKASYTASGMSHAAISGVKSTAYTITAGTRYAYSKVTPNSTAPVSSLTKQSAESTFQTNGADFSYNLGDYIYMYRTTSGRTVETYVLGQWASVTFTALPAVTITQNNGATATYYPYKVGPMEATGSAKYRV